MYSYDLWFEFLRKITFRKEETLDVVVLISFDEYEDSEIWEGVVNQMKRFIKTKVITVMNREMF